MRFLALADTHLGFKAGRTAEVRRITFNAMFDAFENVLKIARQEKIDGILHGGDLFDRGNPPRIVISRTYDLISKFLNNDISFFVVPGNHDRAKLPVSLLPFFNENVYFFQSFSGKRIGDINFFGFPYESKNPKEILGKIRKLVEKLGNVSAIILCHQLFRNATFGPHQFCFKSGKDILHSSILPPQVQFVLTGHIHRAQSLQHGKVFYPGSVERTSFVEVIEPKGCLIIKIEPDFRSVEFRELPSNPMKVIEFDISRSTLDYPSLVDKVPLTFGRTLLRFTGRPLKSEELSQLYKTFLSKDYPWLQFIPTQTQRVLNPLYTQKIPFNF
ncbi:MAG: metallophosphoesterase [Promethearchaeota archaeon]